MSERREPHSLRCVVRRLLTLARDELGLSRAELRHLISTHHDELPTTDKASYQKLASLADSVTGRTPLGPGVVDGFYSRAKRGLRGESLFVSGIEALRMHGYSQEIVARLQPDATSRFLGLGNVWQAVTPKAGARVIDVGCGSGVDLGIAATLSGPSAFLVGVDKRPDLLEIAARACPQASLIIGDISSLPLSNNSFDVVLANGLPQLQRLPTLAITAKNLYALTAPGGAVSGTVIVASPALTSALAAICSADDFVFHRGLATLISGKPTTNDARTAFERLGAAVELIAGSNPYRHNAAHERTTLVTVAATRP